MMDDDMKIKRFSEKAQVDRCIIHHDVFSLALSTVVDAIEYRRATRMVKNLLVVGDSGCGKSSLCNEILRRNPNVEAPDRILTPIVYLLAPTRTTSKALGEKVLQVMGDPFSHRGSAEHKANRIIHYFRQLGVIALIVDEAQHLVEGRNLSEVRATSDYLKQISDQAQVNLVLVGLPRCKDLIVANEQLRRRLSTTVQLSRFGITTRAHVLQFESFFKALVRQSEPKAELAWFTSDHRNRLWFACNGIPHYAKALVLGAIDAKLELGREHLCWEHFVLAFHREVSPDEEDARNPLSENWDGVSVPSVFQCEELLKTRQNEPVHILSRR